MEKYDPAKIEPKWQKVWEEKKLNVTDIRGAKKPFYNLMMFPYPSAEGLHVGNTYAFIAADIYGRFKRLTGFDVFEPIGLDGFGIHSENYALKIGQNPMALAKVTEKRFYREQLAKLGNMYDWSRTVETYKPDYYRWTQWLFIKMFKAGLAYRALAEVNFCPSCKTVLSDEQVIDGKCERCSTEVVKKNLEQWFFKITKYADRLLEGHNQIDWSEKVVTSQKNWIGKKTGALIKFKDIEIFTTRPETVFGATFIVLSPNHPLANKVKTVINPVNHQEIPVFTDEYVLDAVGTGAIMGVPGHDDRDLAFAKRLNLPVIKVINENGVLVNSGFLNGLNETDAFDKIITYLEKERLGGPKNIYHLRDWLISRQRYWGPPIPMIFCAKCQWVPVPEEDLPVVLPDIADYQPEGSGKGPLAKHTEFYETVCPRCGAKARRETDVSDTFLDSAWYELRYPSVGAGRTIYKGEELPWNREITQKWLPVDMYTGGAEHAVLHLMYFRFVVMALHDLGYLPFAEPCKRFFAHGMLIKDGAKMSKSKGNVVNPDEYIAKFGADTLRLYLMFMGPVANGGDWRDTGIRGMRRWTERLWTIINSQIAGPAKKANSNVEMPLSRLIRRAEADIEARHYNTTIAGMMEFLNLVTDQGLVLTVSQIKKFLIVLAPFAPHLTEELWQKLVTSDQSVHQQPWPEAPKTVETAEKVTIVMAVNGKPRGKVVISSKEATALDETKLTVIGKNDPRVGKYLRGKKIGRVVYVSGKIANFVVV